MDFDQERAGVIQLIEQTVIDHRYEILERVIRVSWNPKMIDAVARAGSRGWSNSKPDHVIELSKPLWPAISHRDRYETVLHELAHVVVHQFHGPQAAGPDGHGEIWVKQMRVFGLKPVTCLRDIAGVMGTCPCQTRYVKPPECFIVWQKIRAGGSYRCKSCKQIIQFESR